VHAKATGHTYVVLRDRRDRHHGQRLQYAAAEIPGYPVVHFDKDWGTDQRDRGVPARLVRPPVRRARRAPPGADTGRAASPHRDVRGPPAPL